MPNLALEPSTARPYPHPAADHADHLQQRRRGDPDRRSLYPGRTIVEAGTGSAGLTPVLAPAVMPTGHVYSYETRSESFDMAESNLAELELHALCHLV